MEFFSSDHWYHYQPLQEEQPPLSSFNLAAEFYILPRNAKKYFTWLDGQHNHCQYLLLYTILSSKMCVWYLMLQIRSTMRPPLQHEIQSKYDNINLYYLVIYRSVEQSFMIQTGLCHLQYYCTTIKTMTQKTMLPYWRPMKFKRDADDSGCFYVRINYYTYSRFTKY